MSGPGLIWSNSKITAPETLSSELFERWYDQKHIPDVMGARAGGVVAAWRYKCLDPDRDTPYLTLYNVPDLEVVTTEEFKAIPMTSEMLPSDASIHTMALFDTRFYRRIQVHERAGAKKGA